MEKFRRYGWIETFYVKNCQKEGEEEFDIPMFCYDGEKVCEIVGCFMLNELSCVIEKDLAGLYQDDGLGILKNLSGPDIE